MSAAARRPPAALAPALERYRAGDLAGARRAAASALAAAPDDPALLEFAGLLAGQAGDHEAAVGHFRDLLARSPGQESVRVNLATALVALGRFDEAVELGGESANPRLLRLVAYAHQQQGRHNEAAAAYRRAVAAWPEDFESWNNLGNSLTAVGDLDGAIDAFGRAIDRRPDIPQIYLNLSEALAGAERFEARARLMREAARIFPRDPTIQTELGLAEASLPDYAAAEKAYREAIRLDPNHLSAFLELAMLLENLNRTEELDRLADEAEAKLSDRSEGAFIRAWALRRQGRHAEALPLAEATPATIHPVRRAQLIAELHDRLGDSERAFAAFEEMNRAAVAAKPASGGPTYRQVIERRAALLTPEWAAGWARHDTAGEGEAPIFILGFPRSGTTLLDTLLMNVPDFHVLEELPVLRQPEAAAADEAALPTLGRDETLRLRRLYFDALEAISPPPPGHTVVDKSPLHMARVPLLHRLFPDSKVILVERHPCDVVLSCFMSNFQLNFAMRSFTDLDEAARTYDAAFDLWTRATELLPVDVHRIRYERMVEDLEAEMRPLIGFLGRDWDPAVLDNQASAARRDHIRTASYAQVVEPIYKRSAGRWTRYRAQLAPVLPILAPWAERMGYEV